MGRHVADWISMCQNRSGRWRSSVSRTPQTTTAGNAIRYPSRAAARWRPPPKMSMTTARKYEPPARPPTKK